MTQGASMISAAVAVVVGSLSLFAQSAEAAEPAPDWRDAIEDNGWARAAALGFVVAALASTAVMAQPRQLPSTPEEYYAAAEVFAECAAGWQFASDAAKSANLPETSVAFGDTARGWRVAGQFFLAESMTPAAQPRTVEQFGFMEAGHLQGLRANRELRPETYQAELIANMHKVCDPWADTQKVLIDVMRRSAPSPAR